jgi:hypothetical protein
MWQVSKSKCLEANCLNAATYGSEPNKPLKCFEHKDKLIYVMKTKRCMFENCKVKPIYGIIHCQPEYCKLHIPNTLYVDVTHTKCKFDGCQTRPTFGKGKTSEYCKVHKTEGYKDVLNKRCEYENCEKYPAYGEVEGIAIRCSEHKTEHDFNVFAKSIKRRYELTKDTPKVKAIRQNYYLKNKVIITQKSKQFYNKNYFQKLARKCLQRSKTKNISYDLTQEFIEYIFESQNNRCIYCNCELDTIAEVGKRKMNLISIDRIKSNIGYIKGNVQITCMFCNYAKNRWTDLEYKDFVQCLRNKDNSKYLYHKAGITWLTCQQMPVAWAKEQFEKQNGKCFYSGLDLIPSKIKYFMYQPSIERLDCNIGYIPENCVLVCLSLNYARNNCNVDQFKEHLQNNFLLEKIGPVVT